MKKITVLLLAIIGYINVATAQQSAETYLKEAEALINEKKPKEAMVKLDEMMKYHPKDGKGRMTRAILGIILDENMEKVGEDMTYAAEFSGKRDSMFVNLAFKLINEKKYDGAKSIIGKGIKKYPKSPALHATKGEVAYRTSNYKGAKKSLKKALKLQPDFIYALTIQAKNQAALKQNAKALVTVNKVLEKRPKLVSALVIRAGLYKDSEQYEKAITDLENATAYSKAREEKAFYTAQRAMIYKEMNEQEKACKLAKMAADIGDKSAIEAIGKDNCEEAGGKYWVQKESLLVYEVMADDIRYNFEVQVLNYSPEKIRFLWAMDANRKNTNGTITMLPEAIQNARVQHNYFENKAQPKFTDKSSVWISQTVFNELKNNKSSNIDTGSGMQKFTVTDERPYTVYNGYTKQKLEIQILEIKSENEKETLLIADNAENPLVVGMDLGWKMALRSVF